MNSKHDLSKKLKYSAKLDVAIKAYEEALDAEYKARAAYDPRPTIESCRGDGDFHNKELCAWDSRLNSSRREMCDRAMDKAAKASGFFLPRLVVIFREMGLGS